MDLCWEMLLSWSWLCEFYGFWYIYGVFFGFENLSRILSPVYWIPTVIHGLTLSLPSTSLTLILMSLPLCALWPRAALFSYFSEFTSISPIPLGSFPSPTVTASPSPLGLICILFSLQWRHYLRNILSYTIPCLKCLTPHIIRKLAVSFLKIQINLYYQVETVLFCLFCSGF